MLDLLLRGARLPGEMETRDIGIKDGLISELEPEAQQTIDLAGALVTPALVEPHSHVDVCDPELRAVRALVELRKEIGDQMYLQLVAFPQQGIMSFDGGQDLMRRAIDLGVDVVGAIPHFELTREYGEQSIKFAFA